MDGVGRIEIVKEELDPVHPFNVGITAIVPVIVAFEVFAGAL